MTNGCPFCTLPFEHRIIKRFDHWTVHVADSQQLLGYIIISLNDHREHFIDLNDDELVEFRDICKEMQNALQEAFMPDWYNYQLFGNMTRHLHFHLIPRYKEPRIFDSRTFIDRRFGKSPERRWIFEEDDFLGKLAEKIKEKL